MSYLTPREHQEMSDEREELIRQRDQALRERDAALAGIEAMRHLNDKDREAWLYSVQHHHDEACRYKGEREEAQKAAREYFEASLHEVVGRSCYAEVVEDAYTKYPFLKEMHLDP